MQFLKIKESTTLSDLSKQVGQRNVDSILAANDLKRSPNIGKQFKEKCDLLRSTAAAVDWQRKSSILNTMTGDAEVFGEAALLSDEDWSVLSSLGTLPSKLKIPESIKLPNSVDIVGSSGESIAHTIYIKAMDQLKTQHWIDPSIFNEYNGTIPAKLQDAKSSYAGDSTNMFSAFSLPWGNIQLYSSLSGETIDFPVYPEELNDSRKANYTQMPDLIYQYEPWQMYESSGPREMNYTFHFHRDMWTGDHSDGNANKLIRFCEANCYPSYNGSTVNSAIVKMYINGSLHISGVMTSVDTKWSGPLGQDNWYLECELQLSITEVSETALSYSAMRSKSLIGG